MVAKYVFYLSFVRRRTNEVMIVVKSWEKKSVKRKNNSYYLSGQGNKKVE